MNEEVKILAELRHIGRDKRATIGMLCVSACLLGATSSLLRYTHKPASYALATGSLGIMVCGGAKIARIEKRENQVRNRLAQIRKEHQNG